MYKNIVLCLLVSLSGVLCEYINKKEGDECEWEGLKGRCVKETSCLTTLDDDSPKHPVCSKNMGEKIICCTDCKLVNSTKNAIFIPPYGLFWKNGQKARDNCLQYLQDLPYKCKEDGFYAGISREFDEDNECYEYIEWDVDSSSSEDKKPRAEHPHKVLLGYTYEWITSWGPGGFIISDKYIVTAATTQVTPWGKLQLVAVGVSNRWDSALWQTHFVKRLIPHPKFNFTNRYFNDIALIETETAIKFNENVLPACLHVEKDASVEEATTTPWAKRCDEVESLNLMERIQTVDKTIKLREFSENECKATYNAIVRYDHKTQMCYGNKSFKKDPSDCLVPESDPLMITTQFSSCVYTAIGVSIVIGGCTAGFCQIYTRVSHYVPWIESIVWPDEA